MGKIRDWCLATGLEETKYRAQDFKVSSSAMKGKLISLPAPYNQRITGQTEAPILKALIEGLNAAGIWNCRIEGGGKLLHTGRGMIMAPSAMTGMPDLIACHHGRLVAIEAKAPGGKLSAQQHGKLISLNHAGALVMIVVSPEKALERLLRGCEATCVLESGLQVF